jgi:hypothetical protein
MQAFPGPQVAEVVMPRCGWTALVVVAALVAGNWDGSPSRPVPGAGPLQGVWVITSVHRNGARDASQIQGIITISGDTVQFEPTTVALEAVNIPDGTG